jgi:hypothetical protein
LFYLEDMKTIKFLTYLILPFLAFTSCQKDIPDINALTGNFRAKINGTQWRATASASATMNSGIITLTGVGNRKSLNIVLLGNAPGTYILNDTTFNNASYTDSTNSSGAAFSTNQGGAAVAGGQVTITRIDNVAKTMTGTFSFKTFRASDSIHADFTEGIFEDIKFTSQVIAPGPVNATDTLNAVVEGNTFNATAVSGVLSGTTITVGGIAAGGKAIAIIIPSTVTPGTYLIGPMGSNITATYTNGSSISMSVTGALNVIQHDSATKRLQANFNFTAADIVTSATTVITQGYISVVHN